MALLVLLFASVLAQTDFTANFQMSTPLSGLGRIPGVVHFGWKQAVMSLTFPDYAVKKEVYSFNNNRGYSNFDNQFSFTTSTTCGCASKALQFAQPHLYDTSPELTKTGTNALTGCTIYTKKKSSPTGVQTVEIQGSRVCSFTLTDGRTFELSNYKATPVASIPRPADCPCRRELDVEIMLDHSGSVSLSKMNQMKTFVQNFVKGFSITPGEVNLGMSWFHRNVATYFPVTGDRKTVDSVIAAWVRSKCTTCGISQGTGISSGVRYAANRLKDSKRNVRKMLVLITDGAMNHLWGGKYDGGASTNRCNKWDTTCNADLQASVDYAKRLVPGVTLITVGVGAGTGDTLEKIPCTPSTCVISFKHLMISADQIRSNVLFASDFDKLGSIANSLMNLVCDSKPDPCELSCCGVCVCGKCLPPKTCVSPDNLCLDSTLPAGGCCKTVPKAKDPCPKKPCSTSNCDPLGNKLKGQCFYTSSCPIDSVCFTHSCENSQCKATLTPACTPTAPPTLPPTVPPPTKPDDPPTPPPTNPPTPPPIPPPECFTDADCLDLNECTNQKCITLPDGAKKCNVSQVDCSLGKPPNVCVTHECFAPGGCRELPALFCDDLNNCTIDTCDPVLGCVHAPKVCEDESRCYVGVCDPVTGCGVVERTCPHTRNCSRAYCVNDTSDDVKYRKSDDPDDPCREKALVCIPIGAIAGGAIAGIIAAGLLALAICGGGTYAAANAATNDEFSAVDSNPMYEKMGVGGESPIFSMK